MIIKVNNLEKLISKFDAMGKVDVMPVITWATAKVQSSAKDLVPVDTGDLRNSISRKTDRTHKIGTVYTTLEYAPYQEFGTVKMRASPFMVPALNINRVGISNAMEGFIKLKLKSPSASWVAPHGGDKAGRDFTYKKTSGGKVSKTKLVGSGKTRKRNILSD